MRLLLVTVGKPRDRALAQAISEYEGRAARYWKLTIHEVRSEPAGSAPRAMVADREGKRLLDAVPRESLMVLCAEGGRAMSSFELASWLGAQRDAAVDVAFVIGGAFGTSPEVASRASFALALAPWTLPHELARLVLAEQIYRAGTILRGEPYHK